MKNIKDISFENLMKEYENNSELRKSKNKLKELAGIDTTQISPKINQGLKEFEELINKASDEIERRRNK
jgi:hypothetical protein